MSWRRLTVIFVLGVIAIVAYRHCRHYGAAPTAIYRQPQDPFQNPATAHPAPTNGPASPAAAPGPVHSASLDQSMKTIDDVNRINKLNQQQRQPQPQQTKSGN